MICIYKLKTKDDKLTIGICSKADTYSIIKDPNTCSYTLAYSIDESPIRIQIFNRDELSDMEQSICTELLKRYLSDI